MCLAWRRVVDGVVHEEMFTQRLQWEPTEFFELYRLGHDDERPVEITKEEAEAYMNRPRPGRAASGGVRKPATEARPGGHGERRPGRGGPMTAGNLLQYRQVRSTRR